MDFSPPPPDVDCTLVARYFANELTAAERLDVERWVEAQPARQEEMALLRQLWDDAAAIPGPAEVEGLWRSLSKRMRSPRSTPSGEGNLRREARTRRVSILPLAPPRGRWTVPAAAAAAALLTIGVVLVDRHFALREASTAVAPIREFRTAPGQRATIRLGDGSRVELGMGSVIRLEPFTATSRTVTLEGEAVFDVAHEERRPFRVHSAGTITEDLGTRFGIRAYPGDSGVRVVVVSGLVSVRSIAAPGSPRTLRPAELVRVDARGAMSVEANVDTARYLAWTNGRIVLHDEPLRSAAVEIGRWHDVAVVVPDEDVARLRITADMRLGSLEETLAAVTIPLGLRYERSEAGVVIVR
jgi:transmembrane sensor